MAKNMRATIRRQLKLGLVGVTKDVSERRTVHWLMTNIGNQRVKGTPFYTIAQARRASETQLQASAQALAKIPKASLSFYEECLKMIQASSPFFGSP